MSAFKQSMRKLGVRAGLLAGTSLAVVAIAGVGASSASAACTTPAIEGQGSSLQKVAQLNIWTTGYNGALCPPSGGAEASYTSTSSGKGMGKWGLNGGTFTTSVSFVGTDDGPTANQQKEMREKSSGGLSSEMVVVPVAQTAISIVYNPPAGCEVTGEHITNANLEKVFSGATSNWESIGAVKIANPAEKCSGNITRVVRKEGSGTTFQFKNYLAKVNALVHSGEAVACEGQKKWSELEAIGTEEKPNITWPECGTIATSPKEGGGGVAKFVQETAGTIGYAALPDAKGVAAGAAKVLKVQNNGVSASPIYKAPEEGEEARCSEAEYTVPVGGRNKAGESGIGVDWSAVFGGQPGITGNVYPICTLTYDLGWHVYTTAGFGSTVGASVKSYENYVITHLGSLGSRKYYATLPEKISATEEHNVQGAAVLAVSKIG